MVKGSFRIGHMVRTKREYREEIDRRRPVSGVIVDLCYDYGNEILTIQSRDGSHTCLDSSYVEVTNDSPIRPKYLRSGSMISLSQYANSNDTFGLNPKRRYSVRKADGDLAIINLGDGLISSFIHVGHLKIIK